MWRHLKLSIPTRIFLSFAVILTSFGALSITSLVTHDRTVRMLRLLHEGYLPLALTLGEAKGTQALLVTQLEAVMQARGAEGTRRWVDAFRHVRPASQRRYFHRLERAERLARDADPDDRRALRRVRRVLSSVREDQAELDPRYDALFVALERGDGPESARIFDDVRRLERDVSRRYREGWRELQERIATISADVENQERRSAGYLGVLTVLALLLGVFVIWASQRLLRPLPELQARVEAVARGEREGRIENVPDDELGRLTTAFEDMVEALDERDLKLIQSERLAAIGRMAAHVTHEVRNPLSSIGLNVEMLEDELPPDAEEARALIAAIHGEVDRLTGITEEYLRLARLPDPQLGLEDPRDWLESTAEFVRREMEAADVELELHIDDSLPQLAMDEAQLRQALLNLLRNARESMPGGGRTKLSLLRVEDGVEIVVEDEGEGIPEQERGRIFELFFTTKQRGTGLGLPLTEQIVVAHGGTIVCEAAASGGTRFTIHLPAAQPPRDMQASAPWPAQVTTEKERADDA
ncbi:MAG: HAMP domain-containing histidine kinase [Deltaproteobacteria bacterium]|nr:HAMP domain-containing histidine kinase [Deltaproteobacteria bacterium]